MEEEGEAVPAPQEQGKEVPAEERNQVASQQQKAEEEEPAAANAEGEGNSPTDPPGSSSPVSPNDESSEKEGADKEGAPPSPAADDGGKPTAEGEAQQQTTAASEEKEPVTAVSEEKDDEAAATSGTPPQAEEPSEETRGEKERVSDEAAPSPQKESEPEAAEEPESKTNTDESQPAASDEKETVAVAEEEEPQQQQEEEEGTPAAKQKEEPTAVSKEEKQHQQKEVPVSALEPEEEQPNTISVGTDDLEQYADRMEAQVKVRLAGDGTEQSCFVALPLHASIKRIRERLEARFDRRLTIAFSVTSVRGEKLLELRPSTLKVFNALAPEDRLLVCRSLFPQLSRARSSTPHSMSRDSVLALATQPQDVTNIRSSSSLSHEDEAGLVRRLYSDSERNRAIKLLQLEDKHMPRAKLAPIDRQTESDLLDRLTNATERRKEGIRSSLRQKYEREGYILPPPTHPDVEEEQAVIQKFFYERLKKEKVREQLLEKQRFKPPAYLKLKTEEEWKAWQEKRKRDIKKEFRLRDQFY